MKYKYSKLARKLNPTMSWEVILECHNRHNYCTGKTTGEILELLGWCIRNVEIKTSIDGWFECDFRQIKMPGGVLEHLKETIKKLELDYFKIDELRGTIEYNPYGYVTKDWVVVE